MHCGICLLSVVPGRKEPSHASEMVTQLLFGEHYEVIEEKEGWVRVRNDFDSYTCWISARQHNRIPEPIFRKIRSTSPHFTAEPVQQVRDVEKRRAFPVLIGSALPLFENGSFVIENRHFSFQGKTAALKNAHSGGNEIEATAALFLNAPYLWGGRSYFGIDCSGFVQTVYKLNGVKLPRDAAEQVSQGKALDFVEEAEKGDLAFFDNETGKIVHVGIMLGDEKIIHASGSVRVDKIDHFGIFNLETKKYSHNLRVIKRVIKA
jgi:hypothetical protein